MSAKNWRVCPQCLQKAKKKRDKAIATAEAKYGVVSAAEYRQAINEANQPVEPVESMREDYHIGVYEDGKFTLSYSAACENCDFGFEKKLEEVAFATKGKT